MLSATTNVLSDFVREIIASGLPLRQLPYFSVKPDGRKVKHGATLSFSNELLSMYGFRDVTQWKPGLFLVGYVYDWERDIHRFKLSGPDLPAVPEGSTYPSVNLEAVCQRRSSSKLFSYGGGGSPWTLNGLNANLGIDWDWGTGVDAVGGTLYAGTPFGSGTAGGTLPNTTAGLPVGTMTIAASKHVPAGVGYLVKDPASLLLTSNRTHTVPFTLTDLEFELK